VLVYSKRFKSAWGTFLRHETLIFLLLTVFAGVLIYVTRSDYQPFVSQGDHGRDLYAFKRVVEAGAVPYRDFSWLFGPLMLYYYAAFFKLLGVTIQSAIIAQNILVVLTGVFLYLTASRFMPAALSFCCALWYWAFRGREFFYTYNHSGGLLCLVILAFALFRYLEDSRIRHVIAGFVAAFLFLLIRPNMAVAVLAGWVVSLALADLVNKSPLLRRNFRIYLYGSFLCVLLAGFIYWLYFRGLPDFVLWESFPITPQQRTDVSLTLVDTLKFLGDILSMIFSSSKKWPIVTVLSGIAALVTIVRLALKGAGARQERVNPRLVLVSLLILVGVTFHEYMLSGIYYRLYWELPLVLLVMFFLFGFATAGPRLKIIRWMLYAGLFWMAFSAINAESRQITSLRTPAHMLQWGKNRVYTLQPAQWFDAVHKTCAYIDQNVPAGEKMFSVPFDTLYNFLTGHDQPTRQWTFFKHFIIPPEQDLDTIRDLEREKVNWVLLSNRAISLEAGLGIFGRDYCHILGKYILTEYEPVAQIGWWTRQASWAWDHGVVMLKRKTPFAVDTK
jgi:hypothetical protein